MAEEIENTNKQIIVGRTSDGKYIVIKVNDDGESEIVLKGNSDIDGSGTVRYVIVDSAGRLHTRGFRDAAGNGRRMLVDDDRHGQIDIVGASVCCDALVVARAVHHRIKESKEFYANYCWSAIADTNSVYFLIKAGDKTPHGNIGIMTSGKANLFLYETPTITGDGTTVIPRCLNRETDASPDATFFRDPTIGADGTELECALLGAAGKFSAVGGETTGAYWWFDHNKNYTVKVTNTSGGVIDIAIGYDFHEHTAI